MSQRTVPKISKWPFYLADILLLAFAVWILTHYPHPLAPWAGGLMAGCVTVAALLAVWPHRLQYDAELKFAEADRLTETMAVLRDLDKTSQFIREATSQWQGVQDSATRTTQSAREIAERMTAEARAFSEFMAKANDTEKATLRLEAEKLRRGEGQWLQVIVHLLDHVHALHNAGARSGQPQLVAQLAAFQGACREIGRRVGLNVIEVPVGTPFDPEAHDLMEGQNPPVDPTAVSHLVATGFTFQGQVIRRPIVVLATAASPDETVPPEPSREEEVATLELAMAEEEPVARGGEEASLADDGTLVEEAVASDTAQPDFAGLEASESSAFRLETDEPGLRPPKDRQSGNV